MSPFKHLLFHSKLRSKGILMVQLNLIAALIMANIGFTALSATSVTLDNNNVG